MSHPQPPVAIVGMASLFPQAESLAAYWRNILDATDCISDVPDDHSWTAAEHFSDDPDAKDKTWCTRGGFLDKVPFDPVEFGIPPNILESIDTTQLLSLIVARECLKDAGLDPEAGGWDRDRVACILGITGTQEMAINAGARLFGPTWRKALKRCGVDDAVADKVVQDIGAHLPTWTEQTFPGLLGNVVTGRISNRFNLGGTNAVVDAACASSLAAMQYALGDLLAGRSDVVLTGGADTLNDAFMYQCFTRTPAFSKRGDAAPFDAASDGILIGEGIAILALKRLEDAERDGDRIYAVIKGLGSASDGRYKSIYAPNPDGQAKCLRRAYDMAEISPATVELVECHGTGTKAGDAAEIEGLKQVYGEVDRDGQWVQIGSVKSQIGHTKSTAGAAGLLKVALALHQRVLPPAAKVTEPNPKMGFDDSPFFLSPHARPWVRAGDHPRRAAVSAFGFGGTNFHAVLEEYGDPNAVAPMGAPRGDLFLLEASTAEGLKAQLDGLIREAPTLSHLARETVTAYTGDQPHVVGFVAGSEPELLEAIATARTLIERGAGSRSDVHYGVRTAAPGKLAFIFPGQGSQYVEMGRDLAVRWPVVRAAYDRADEAMRLADRAPLSGRIFPPPAWTDAAKATQEEALRDTTWAQPAIGAFSKGLLDLLTSFGLAPDATAGHSYGELVALHAAGVLSEDELWTASRVRGECMGGDEDRGTMAAVSGDLDAIQAVLDPLRKVLLANRNHPEQGVISGTQDGIDTAVEALEAAGMTARPIAVAAAFHSPMVGDAAEPFAAALGTLDFKAPRLQVWSNASAAPYPDDADACRAQLAAQITSPVDWVGIVNGLADDGVRVFVEVGPKGVLSNLVRKTLGSLDGLTVVSLDRHRHRVDGDVQLKNALAQLAAAGVAIDLSPLLAQPLPPAPLRGRSKATVGLAGANFRNPSTWNPPAPTLPARPPAPPAPARPSPIAAATPATPQGAQAQTRVKTPVPTPQPRAAAPSRAPAPQGVPMSQNNALQALLDSTRQTLLSFQATQERTAAVHSQFLEAHAEANASFSTLFQTHARLVELAATGQVAPAPHTARVDVPAFSMPTAAAPQAAPMASAMQATGHTAGLQSVMSTEAKAVLDSVLAGGSRTPATMSLPGLESAVSVSSDLPPLMTAAAQPISAAAHSPAPSAAPAAPAPAGSSSATSHAAIVDAMLGSVADKTGYPRDMLELSMDMESDLGIDSIKRVEIMSAVQEQVPALPELDNDRMSALRTLDEVVSYLAEVAGSSLSSGDLASSETGVDHGAIVDAMLGSVADKTGYPRDMLELSMDMESDLGIDSIKRVEIMSAVQEQVPGLPELDNDRMSALRTLDEVVSYLAEVAGSSLPSAARATVDAPGGPTHAAIVEAMLSSVADKTGYPRDMLELSMDMESDLGIDSIKRVEILAAVQDQVPGLPELDNDRMSALRTLDQVIGYLAEAGGSTAPAAPTAEVRPPPAASEPPPAEPVLTLARRSVRCISVGAGQPAPLKGRIAVTADLHGRAEALVAALQARKVQAELIDPAWETVADVKRALGRKKWAGAVHMAALGADAAGIKARVRGAFLLAKALGPVDFLATVSGRGGDFAQTISSGHPLEGALAGLPKTLAQEWSDSRLMAVDTHPDTEAEALADVLLTDWGSLEVGVGPAGVQTLHNALTALPDLPVGAPVAPGDLVVVSGGARGVTAAVAIELARRYQPTLLLLGRSALSDEPSWAHGIEDAALQPAWISHARARGDKPTPKALNEALRSVRATREIRSNLRAMTEAGATAHYRSVDIRNADGIAAAVADLNAGPVRGIVHGAGVLADKLLVDKSEAAFDRVFDTKVDGLSALLSNTDDALKMLVLFSSVAGRYGNIGQCDYSMANEALTHQGLDLARRGVRVKSLDWGPWEAGMVTPELRRKFEAAGISVIPLDAGARFAADELERGGPAVEVVVEGPRPAQGAVDRTLSVVRHPWLVDHSIDGTPVVPVAMVLEWFADAARQVYPGLQVVEVADLAVLKGIVLSGGRAPVTLSWTPAAGPAGEVALAFELHGAAGPGGHPVPHYRATVRLSAASPPLETFPGSNGLGKNTWTAETYGKWLFHGPRFHGIDEIVGYSDHGMVAWLQSSAPVDMGLGDAAWTTDPLAVDSALQLMLLWVGETQGARALPCAIRNFRQLRPFQGRIACHLEMENADARHGTFRATFVNEAGEVVARLNDGEYAARQ